MKKQHKFRVRQIRDYISDNYLILIQNPKQNPRKEYTFKKTEEDITDAITKFNNTGAKWVPAGGIEVTLRLGYAARNHTDIDIEVEESELPKFKEGMETQNYKLWNKRLSINLNLFHTYKKRISFYTKLDMSKETLGKQIRLVHNNPYQGPELLRIIDVKVCRHTPNGTIINNRGKIMTINKTYNGPEIKFKDIPIQLRNLEFRNLIKPAEKNTDKDRIAINRYDNIVLDQQRETYGK